MISLLLRSGSRHRLLPVAASFPFLRSFPSAAPVGKDDSGDFELIDQRKLPGDYDPNTFDPSAPQRSPPSDRVWRLVDELAFSVKYAGESVANLGTHRPTCPFP